MAGHALAQFALFLGLVLPMFAASRFMGSSQSDISTQRSPEMQMKSMAAFALASGVASSSMAADAVQWRVEDGGNGHWYGTISNVPVSPTSMLQSAAALGASPISVNSAVEQQFLEQQRSA